MVLAYALLNVPRFRAESERVMAATPEIWVPESFRAEFANVVWLWVRSGAVPHDVGVIALRRVEGLLTEVHPVNHLWEQALALSLKHGHSVYDTLFIALADVKGCRVITYDADLLARFPDQTVTPGRLLAGRR
jgi:predicted nucleic acid-binding protein